MLIVQDVVNSCFVRRNTNVPSTRIFPEDFERMQRFFINWEALFWFIMDLYLALCVAFNFRSWELGKPPIAGATHSRQLHVRHVASDADIGYTDLSWRRILCLECCKWSAPVRCDRKVILFVNLISLDFAAPQITVCREEQFTIASKHQG